MVRYLVTSGNSRVGNAAVRALHALGETDVVAGARDPVKSEKDLKSAGASKVVELDLSKPETIEKAMEGVERVFIVHGPTSLPNFLAWTHNVINAAKRPGSTVKVLGQLHGYFSDINSKYNIPKNYAQQRQILEHSGFPFFAVGPSFFFENWYDQKQSIQSGTVYGAAGNARVPYIAVDDIGAVIAAVLKNPEKYYSKSVAISAVLLREEEVLKAINDATGLNANYVSMPSNDFENVLKSIGMPDETIELLVELEKTKADDNFPEECSPIIQQLIGRPPIKITQWAHDHASYFK